MKYILGAVAFFTVFTVAVVMLIPSQNKNTAADGSNVTIKNGVQIIDLSAKGGYEPRKTTAKAGMPTTLRVATNGTFDCSSSIRIPTMNISQNLEASGTTDIALGTPAVGALQGTCSMGMYNFEIDFQS